ncbi:uncharacterized protein TRIADDRAFT_60896 [Trichoplax adhaerens]|uniref:Uncharacterized protein n=1 Tax=Trichoplax adhaerens TaxID=10228 RepID=B3S9G2_TRIAD|nr:predicted protein [Trichoplax adhaerens]EDV20695.1 predicted protein [Trichoplax adhaerens]|eukprot:XP_002116895.1 predicted protein [Trichoplax adhaerens]
MQWTTLTPCGGLAPFGCEVEIQVVDRITWLLSLIQDWAAMASQEDDCHPHREGRGDYSGVLRVVLDRFLMIAFLGWTKDDDRETLFSSSSSPMVANTTDTFLGWTTKDDDRETLFSSSSSPMVANTTDIPAWTTLYNMDESSHPWRRQIALCNHLDRWLYSYLGSWASEDDEESGSSPRLFFLIVIGKDH